MKNTVFFLLNLAIILDVTLSISQPSGRLTCATLSAGTNLPCVEVPMCSSNKGSSLIEINELSNGLGKSKSSADIKLCFDQYNLYANFSGYDQNYFTAADQYKNCNDAIFNSDVFEFFALPNFDHQPNCYNELDISPFNIMFEAGIYNPNLNHTGIVGSTMDCDKSGIKHSTSIDTVGHSWTASLAYPFRLLNCPYNCPTTDTCNLGDSPTNVYRANFYRITELSGVQTCSSSTCEYNAWSPTGSNPPAFHEPTKFGYILLQFENN